MAAPDNPKVKLIIEAAQAFLFDNLDRACNTIRLQQIKPKIRHVMELIGKHGVFASTRHLEDRVGSEAYSSTSFDVPSSLSPYFFQEDVPVADNGF